MNRRVFVKVIGYGSLALASGLAMGASSCNSVFKAILSWVSNAGPAAVKAIETLLKAAGVVFPAPLTVVIGLIFTGFTDLSNAVTEYESTTPPPVGALAKIDTVLTDLITNFQGLLNNIPGVGTIISVVLAIVEVVISTIQGFIGSLPASIALPKAQARLKVPLVHAGTRLQVAPVKRTNRQFAQAVNSPIDTASKAGVITALTAKEAKMHVPLF